MQQEALEYGVCLSEPEDQEVSDGHLVDKIEDLRQIDPRMFWSQSTLDEAFRICCVICEQSGGELGAVWRAGMMQHWNLWIQRFRENGMDLEQQLQDRQNTIMVPHTSVGHGFLVLHDGVTWTVNSSEPERFVIVRSDSNRVVNRNANRTIEVVLRSKQ
jgi:hypothetical protein